MIDWHIYNESLVRRGEVVLDFDVIDNWNNELDNMNEGKEGASYVYPDSFVQLLGYMRAYFHLPYRQTEGGGAGGVEHMLKARFHQFLTTVQSKDVSTNLTSKLTNTSETTLS